MDLTGDELAGVVDLFDALTRSELGRALHELAYRRGEERDPDSFAPAIDDAVEDYTLVAFEPSGDDESEPGEELLVAGPVAFPELPEGATDLPHILDVPDRSVDREALGEAVEAKFRADTARAVADGDGPRMDQLLDVSYELEVWAPVDLSGARERLDDTRS